MAGIYQKEGKWIALYSVNGRKRRLSTHIDIHPKDGRTAAQNERLARQAADMMELRDRKAVSGTVAANALRTIAATLDDAPVLTAREYLTSYQPAGKAQNQKNTLRAVDLFLTFLTARKLDGFALADVKRAHAEEFLGEQVQRVAEGTVKGFRDHLVKVFNDAVRSEMIAANPFALTRMRDIMNKYAPDLKGKDKTDIETFSAEEMGIILHKFPQPYCDLAAVSFYTGGQRIGDCINLTWEQVDFERGLIRLCTQKTAKKLAQPLNAELRRRLEALNEQRTDKSEPYVFPDLAFLYARSNGAVSTTFTQYLRLFGILKGAATAPKKGMRRNVAAKRFHSIRHTAASMMQEQGVPQAVSMDVVGHDSRAVHEAYTSTSLAARAEALNKLAEAVRRPEEQ